MFNTYSLLLLFIPLIRLKFVHDLTRTDNFWIGKGKAIYSYGGIRFFSNKVKGGLAQYKS